MSFFDKMRHQKLLSFTLLLFTLSVGILIGTLVNRGVRAERDQVAAPDATPLAIPSPVQLSSAFNQLSKKLEPSVVNIRADFLPQERQQSQTRPGRARPDQGEGDEGFEFFHRFFGPFGQMPEQPDPRRAATGSGVVVDANGYILTNNHVVEKADRIKVKLVGEPKEYEAKLVGTDRETDLAVIKIEAGHKLSPAKIGNSDAVQVGDWAVAIGSPFGLETTVTAGIISAKGRQGRQFQAFLQTDAAINPGNSGGPLLNINGEVVGINTAIATRTGGYQGVGFALPINTAVKVYNAIIKSGKVTRGSIGVELSNNPSPELLKVYGASYGAFVNAVTPGSPADKAGLKKEDVVIAMDGKKIESSDDLVNRVADSEPGRTSTLSVLREGKKQDIDITVGDRVKVWAGRLDVGDDEPEDTSGGEATQAKFGLYVRSLTEADREELGFEEKGGVVVTRVDPASFADDIGVLPNDIILSINRQPVSAVDDIRRIQGGLKTGDAVAFHVKRARGAVGRAGAGRGVQWVSVYPAGTLPEKNGR
jgi:serine protease Do